MAVFDTLGISGSGLLVHRKWLDAVSDNISNINTATRTNEDAFKERFIVARAVDYGSGEGGVRAARAEFGSGQGRLVYDPTHPPADKDGMVKYPDIDPAGQMTQLVKRQSRYPANPPAAQRA